MLGKDKIEAICRSAGMVPVSRDRIMNAEVFVADGFSMPPHRAFKRFGIEPDDFKNGMYCTLWWVSRGEDKLDIGRPVFFDGLHNPEYSLADRKRARINAAKDDAKDYLKQRRQAH